MKKIDEDDDDEFSEFVVSNQMIGSRLASIQDESPVHNFKPKNMQQNHESEIWSDPSSTVFSDFQGLNLSQSAVLPPPSNVQTVSSIQNEPEGDDDDDFGDFTAPPPVIPINTTTNIPKLSQNSLQNDLLFSPTVSNIVKPMEESKPKDIEPAPISRKKPNTSSTTSKDMFSKVPSSQNKETNIKIPKIAPVALPPPISRKKSAQKSFPSIQKTLQPAVQKNSDKYSVLRDIFSVDDSNAPTVSSLPALNTLDISSNDNDDDFGDFVTTSEDHKSMPISTSILSPSLAMGPSLLPDESLHGPAKLASTTKENLKVSDNSVAIPHNFNEPAFIPWHESSPPPILPENIIVNEDIEEMNTQGYNFTDEPAPPPLNKMPSLNLRSMSPEENIESLKNVTKDLNMNTTTTPTRTPTGDFEGFEGFEIKQKEVVETLYWNANSETEIKVFQTIFNILNHAFEIFEDINDEHLKKEVIATKETDRYVSNLIQVYRVYQRLKVTYEQKTEKTEDLKKIMTKINNIFSELNEIFSELIPNNAVWDFSQCKPYASRSCPICHLDLEHWSMETRQNLTDSIIDFKYHSICANFWLNCVDTVLPN